MTDPARWTEAEYEAALRSLEYLSALDPDPESLEGQRLDQLADLVAAYEDAHGTKE